MHIWPTKNIASLRWIIGVCYVLVMAVCLLSPAPVAAATEYDLASSNNYSFKFEGNSTQGSYGFTSTMADLNGDGKKDMLVATRSFGAANKLFIIYSDLLLSFASGSTIDLSVSTNYNVSFQATIDYGLATYNATPADFDGDGRVDLAVTESSGGSAGNGAVYIIRNSIFGGLSGTGNVLNLSDGSSYNVRIDQVDLSNQHFGIVLHAEDIDGNGIDDLLLGNDFTTYSVNHGGSLYLIYDGLLASYSAGTGNVVSINTTSNYNIRIDGPNLASGPNLTNGDFVATDVDGNGNNDLVIGCYNCSNNSRSLSGSIYLLYDSLIRSIGGTGNTVALQTATNYNVRFDGATAGDYFGKTVQLVDLNNNGNLDLLSGASNASYNSRATSGSVFAVSDASFENLTGTGNTVDLATSTNWIFRVDGATAGDKFGLRGGAADFNNDQKIDLFFSAPTTDYNSRSDSGSIYLIYNAIFGGLAGTGNTIDLASNSNYNLRYDAPNSSAWLTGFPSFETRPSLQLEDLNKDDKMDLLARYNNSTGEATALVIYNFPHSFSLNSFDSASGSDVSVTGQISASNSVTNIEMVQYSLDSSTPDSSSWQNCSASDNAFNSRSEGFSCTVNLSSLIGGTLHTVYVRARDVNGSYTAQSNYGKVAFWKDFQPQANINCLPFFKFCIHGGPNLKSNQSIVSSSNLGDGKLGKVVVDKLTNKDDFYVTITSVSFESLPILKLPFYNRPTIPYPWQQKKNVVSDIIYFSAVSAFNGYPIIKTDNPFVVLLSYDPEKLAGRSISSIKVVYFDIATGLWKSINRPLVVNETNNTIATTTTQFSLYTLAY